MINDIVDQVHAQYPELVYCVQQKDESIIFFNKHGLPRVSLIIKQIIQNPFGPPQAVVDLFEYDKKLAKENV